LSSRAKKRRTEQQKKEKKSKRTTEEKTLKPHGSPPFAMAEVRHSGRMMQRRARGYSLGEVRGAGLNLRLARKWGMMVDLRRRSVLEGNVALLKKWAPRTKKTTEERAEGEVRRVERAVEKEVRKVEKKVEKGVKKAEKVEKEVVEKIEAPAKRRSKKKARKIEETT
jgi:ribosomal protein L13E